MPATRILEVGMEVDLGLFSAFLWQQGIRHRIFEERGRQVLELADPAHCDEVRAQLAAWRSGRLELTRRSASAPAPRGAWLIERIQRYPVLATLVTMMILCYPATWPLQHGGHSAWAAAFSFVDVEIVDGHPIYGDLAATLAQGQLWRLITPIFLHFSAAHLLFNLAVVVEFGRRVERGAGGSALGLAVVVIAAVSNLAQYLATGPGLFGGASGVAYGLVGLVIVRSLRHPADPVWRIQRSFAVALIAFLVIMSTGVTEAFGLRIANAAHWAGLGVGALLGALSGRTRSDGDG